MITKSVEKERAIELRKKGLSYREILKEVLVAKSTLSLWLQSVGLSKKQRQRLTEKRLLAARRGAQKRHQTRMENWERIKYEAAKEILQLTKRERWLIGIVLYWGEGSKEKEYGGTTNIKFSNSDPLMILLFCQWLKDFFNISKERVTYELYIHERADWQRAKKYWGDKLSISHENIRIYFKRHNPSPKRKNIGKEYHGLIRIVVPGTSNIVRKISGWVEGIYKHCGVV